MVISTIDEIIAGTRQPEDFLKVGTAMEAAGVFHSLFYATGRPGAAVVPTPGLAGAALTNYLGQIPFLNPGAGQTYLSRFEGSATQAGTLLLCDRLWHNSGISGNTTTAQTVNSVAFPARDRDGQVNGRGVLVGIEVSTATTNASAVTNTTFSYTNPLNLSGRTGTIASFPATAVAGTFVPFQLATADVGVQSIQSVTLGTSYGAGAVVHLVAFRILARVGIPLANVSFALDPVTGGFPRLFDDTVPFLIWLPVSTTAVTVSGQVNIAQG